MLIELRDFLKQLEASGDLIHFDKELSTEYEIAAAIKYVAQSKGKAIIFNKVKGYNIPVVANIFGKQSFVAKAFGVEERDLEETYLSRGENRVEPRMVTQAPVQEIIIEERVNIQQTIPVLAHHEKDAGCYLTSAITIAKDPETGMRGMGIYRIQVKDKDTVGISLQTPPLSTFLAKAERLGKPLDIAIASGVNPLIFCASIFSVPAGVDKFDVAGSFAQEPVRLVKCHSVNVEVPADAEFILEGQILPHKREEDGPFGESTGYYLTYDNPVAKIGAITHRTQPVYHALVPFTSEEVVLFKIMLEPYLLRTVRKELSGVRVKRLSAFTIGEICVVQIEKESEEDASKVIDYLFSMPFTKIVVVVDEDVDITQLPEVAWAVATRTLLNEKLIIKSDLPGLAIDPSCSDLKRIPETSRLVAQTAKIGIDATKPLNELKRLERIDIPLKTKRKILNMMG